MLTQTTLDYAVNVRTVFELAPFNLLLLPMGVLQGCFRVVWKICTKAAGRRRICGSACCARFRLPWTRVVGEEPVSWTYGRHGRRSLYLESAIQICAPEP